jgi:5-methylcytosine-specific restriction endonuclease McrA
MRAKFIMEIDHIIPRCAGGSNHFFNLVGACRGCNNRRSLLYLKFHKVLVVLGQESPAELLARYHSQNTTKQNNGGYDVP